MTKVRRVGVIVPLGEEFEYVREVLTPSRAEVVDGEQYHGFDLPASSVTGVIRVLSDMGQAQAALTADRMINRLGVSLVVVIGTGAGLDGDVRLGDVAVADQIQEHLRKAKVVPGRDGSGVTFERAAESWRANARLLDHVRNFGWLSSGEAALTRWRQSAAGRWPGGGEGPTPPHVHVGPVATGDVVVAAGTFARWIREANRKFVALDMEAGGAALAAYRNESADLLVIRGISDHADEHKKEWDAGHDAVRERNAWRRYAVRNAVEYLVILLSSTGFPWRDGKAARSEAPSRVSAALKIAQSVSLADAAVSLLGDQLAHPDTGYEAGPPAADQYDVDQYEVDQYEVDQHHDDQHTHDGAGDI
ncbi:5'-methylthioadenosine/S-adenosylhomocysteine nucleosidase family protein [Streptomyces shenzhenensis]|uniref:5'-methylthioadenosine/S-adenosylhomocysteine nucleosidase family protein n=1 Tax=Streptomyces shenzhenensis TaxID=943815 RepID=UPI0015F03A5E|nr:5'-methylthioadenosine/S-adenosylhomocysteine nucleosidase [Streptomyces shenzhenensis]